MSALAKPVVGMAVAVALLSGCATREHSYAGLAGPSADRVERIGERKDGSAFYVGPAPVAVPLALLAVPFAPFLLIGLRKGN